MKDDSKGNYIHNCPAQSIKIKPFFFLMKFLSGKFKALMLILIVVRWIGSWVGRKESFYINSQISREQVCGLLDSQQSHCFPSVHPAGNSVPSHHDSQRAVLGKDPPFVRGWLLRECWHCPMGKLWHWFCNFFFPTMNPCI